MKLKKEVRKYKVIVEKNGYGFLLKRDYLFGIIPITKWENYMLPFTSVKYLQEKMQALNIKKITIIHNA